MFKMKIFVDLIPQKELQRYLNSGDFVFLTQHTYFGLPKNTVVLVVLHVEPH